eukprot:4209479-Lingulodinium_polyedra.AAC.1
MVEHTGRANGGGWSQIAFCSASFSINAMPPPLPGRCVCVMYVLFAFCSWRPLASATFPRSVPIAFR